MSIFTAGGQRPPGALLSIAALFISASVLHAAPKVNYLYPAGAGRGQTVTVTANGDFPKWPVQVWADRPGITVAADSDKGKLKVTVAADAAPGVAWLRVYDGEGAAALRPFVIGTLPEVNEDESNDAPTKPQVVEPKVVVNGQLGKNGDVDGYSVALKAGQTLVASVQANTLLGSPMDSVLQVCELVDRRTTGATSSQSPQPEAFVLEQNHDAIGVDPQIAITAPRDGTYLVRLFAFPIEPNSTIAFAGGDTFVYRLTLTAGGYADHALPLAIERGKSADVKLFGWNIPDAAAALSLPPPTEEADSISPPDEQLLAFHADLAGAVPLARIEHASVLAEEASDPATPQAVELPVTISGRLEAAGDADAFRFTAKKSQRLKIRVESRSLGFPVDAVAIVTDEAGKVLMELDDSGRAQRDPDFAFASPADGVYQLTVRDLSSRGGLRFVYRVSILPPQGDYDLSLAADSFTLAAAKPLEIPIKVDRRDGFDDKIEIRAVGLPAGITAEVVTSEPKGDSAKSVKLVLNAAPDASLPLSAPLRIEGKSAGSTPLVRSARFELAAPLTGQHTAAWLTVQK